MARELRLESLARLAFAVSNERGKKLGEYVDLARKLQDGNKTYKAFMCEYASYGDKSDHFAHLKLAGSQSSNHSLDPRVSEYLHLMESEKPTMYLYFLIDDPSRLSAWNCGLKIRATAYALLHVAQHLQKPHVLYEVQRRGQGKIAETAVQLPSLEELRVAVGDLVSRVNSWREKLRISSEPLFWRAFGILCLHDDLQALGKSLPSRTDVGKLLAAVPVDATWGYVHFWAGLQAELYSLRMLKQLLHFCSPSDGTPGELSDRIGSLLDLKRCLESVPAIRDLFEPPTESKDLGEYLTVMCHELALESQPQAREATAAKSERETRRKGERAAKLPEYDEANMYTLLRGNFV
ncbi:MAG: hypothetical protein INR71_00730 [Terriglobus roseus]|nr:hypothetical protein [Terriglobus roseus]